ncbi:MAG: hypothetical protein CBB71_10585 [Rhodopirellula sp. TMED11]|nr:MAG: hypothetical protein CBB71_10585 [Rhodopirellula sp. TMED11]
MHRLLWIGSLVGLLFVSTGCLRHHTRCGSSCSTGACSSGACSSGCATESCGSCGNGGCLSGLCGGCRTGCQAGPLGWGQGGLSYSSCLGQQQQIGQGAGQVAYPYYTLRGPRNFLDPNPPSIGR